MGKIGKFNIIKVRLTLMSIAALAALLDAAVGFDFIIYKPLKIIAFTVLMISIILNLSIDIGDKLAERENEAKEIITRALDIASLTISRGRKDPIRSNLFLHNKGSSNKIEIRFHSSNMETAPDLGIKFDKWQGCVGKAWGYEAGVVGIADQLVPEKTQDWKLTKEQYALTKEIKSIITWPIRDPDVKGKILGILSFDTSSDLSEYFTSEEARQLVADLSGFIGKLLIAYNIKRFLN